MQPYARRTAHATLCRWPLAGDIVKQQNCASSRGVHSLCLHWMYFGDWIKGCAVGKLICAIGVQLVSRLFCFLKDRRLFIILSI